MQLFGTHTCKCSRHASRTTKNEVDSSKLIHCGLNFQAWYENQPRKLLAIMRAGPSRGNPLPTILLAGDSSICAHIMFHRVNALPIQPNIWLTQETRSGMQESFAVSVQRIHQTPVGSAEWFLYTSLGLRLGLRTTTMATSMCMRNLSFSSALGRSSERPAGRQEAKLQICASSGDLIR